MKYTMGQEFEVNYNVKEVGNFGVYAFPTKNLFLKHGLFLIEYKNGVAKFKAIADGEFKDANDLIQFKLIKKQPLLKLA